MQLQADILGVHVVRQSLPETTGAAAAAYAAGLAVGFWKNADETRSNWQADRHWEPRWSEEPTRGWLCILEESHRTYMNWIDVEK